jgi:hypothetical protein
MVNESRIFGFASLLCLVGLGVLLYGVETVAGQELHPLIIVGGVIILVGFSVLTAGVAVLEEDHAGA